LGIHFATFLLLGNALGVFHTSRTNILILFLGNELCNVSASQRHISHHLRFSEMRCARFRRLGNTFRDMFPFSAMRCATPQRLGNAFSDVVVFVQIRCATPWPLGNAFHDVFVFLEMRFAKARRLGNTFTDVTYFLEVCLQRPGVSGIHLWRFLFVGMHCAIPRRVRNALRDVCVFLGNVFCNGPASQERIS
jgi:hypothetical protein